MAPYRCLRQSPGDGLCQSRPDSPALHDSFNVLHRNIRGFLSHRAEFEVVLALHDSPGFVCLTETLLDSSILHPSLTGYELVSRLDRRGGRSGGGIACFAKTEVARRIVHIADSDDFERSWLIIHSDHGKILLGVWYRPPAYGELSSILALKSELALHMDGCMGVVLVGDMNVHHSGWLRHSKGITPEGRCLHKICLEHGLVEHTLEPTRGKYLLDLTLSDIPDTIQSFVRPGVSDHQIVLCHVALHVRPSVNVRREGFQYSKARWTKLCEAFGDKDWHAILNPNDA